MNYWGIWNKETSKWFMWDSGEIIYFPSRTLAKVQERQLDRRSEETEVREITLDSLKDIKS